MGKYKEFLCWNTEESNIFLLSKNWKWMESAVTSDEGTTLLLLLAQYALLINIITVCMIYYLNI